MRSKKEINRAIETLRIFTEDPEMVKRGKSDYPPERLKTMITMIETAQSVLRWAAGEPSAFGTFMAGVTAHFDEHSSTIKNGRLVEKDVPSPTLTEVLP